MGEATTITDGTTDPQIAAEETLGVGDGSAGRTRHDSKEMIRLLGLLSNKSRKVENVLSFQDLGRHTDDGQTKISAKAKDS
jgi:hypothetical protein